LDSARDDAAESPTSLAHWSRAGELLRVFLRLGLTSFGGPVAHLGYFRQEFVERRHWLTEKAYSDLVALCQLLPDPASSQVPDSPRTIASAIAFPRKHACSARPGLREDSLRTAP